MNRPFTQSFLESTSLILIYAEFIDVISCERYRVCDNCNTYVPDDPIQYRRMLAGREECISACDRGICQHAIKCPGSEIFRHSTIYHSTDVEFHEFTFCTRNSKSRYVCNECLDWYLKDFNDIDRNYYMKHYHRYDATEMGFSVSRVYRCSVEGCERYYYYKDPNSRESEMCIPCQIKQIGIPSWFKRTGI